MSFASDGYFEAQDESIRQIAAAINNAGQELKQNICILIYAGQEAAIPLNRVTLAQIINNENRWIVYQDDSQIDNCAAPFIETQTSDIPFCHITFDSIEAALLLAITWSLESQSAITAFAVLLGDNEDEYKILSRQVIDNKSTNLALQQHEDASVVQKSAKSTNRFDQDFLPNNERFASKEQSWWSVNKIYVYIGVGLLLVIATIIGIVYAFRKNKSAQKIDSKATLSTPLQKVIVGGGGGRGSNLPVSSARRIIQEPKPMSK